MERSDGNGAVESVAGSPESLILRTGHGPVPLGFVQEAKRIFLVARERSAAWPVDLLRRGVAELEVSGGALRGSPRLVTSASEREAILGRFLEKYGERRYRRWYDHPARVLEVRLGDPPAASGDAGERYYGWIESEFDNVAEDYDHHITGNRINRLLRDRSLRVLRSTFRDARRLFEIGCGSGMETLPLLREGHEIVAVDISERMLAVVREKARQDGLSERLQTVQLRARDLSRMPELGASGPFDGGYSTYGALNCEAELAPIAAQIGSLLPPGHRFVTGIYNRWCLFELLGYSLSLQGSRAFGRRTNPIPVGASRFCVDVYAYSLSDVRRYFAPDFSVDRVEGVPVLLPPSDLTGYAERFSRRFAELASIDAWVGRRWPWYALGDHFLLTFRRDPPAR